MALNGSQIVQCFFCFNLEASSLLLIITEKIYEIESKLFGTFFTNLNGKKNFFIGSQVKSEQIGLRSDGNSFSCFCSYSNTSVSSPSKNETTSFQIEQHLKFNSN